MLVLTIRPDDEIVINGIKIIALRKGKGRSFLVGVEAPEEVKIEHRRSKKKESEERETYATCAEYAMPRLQKDGKYTSSPYKK